MLKPFPSEETDALLFKVLTWHKEKLGMPMSFLNRLSTDDDWTVVIKIHAMIEAGLNRLITKALGDNRVSEIVDRMDTGDRQRGKLAFVKALDLLPSDTRNFIQILSQLRNDLVHDVRNFEFSFTKWLEDMKEADLKNLRKYVSTHIKHPIPYGDEMLSSTASLHRSTRYTILLAAFVIVGHIFKRDLELPDDEMESPLT